MNAMKEKVTIDHVPLPESVLKRYSLDGLPLDTMRVGESFLVPMGEPDERDRRLNALRMRVFRYNKKHPAKRFSVINKAEEESGFRVFRIF